MLLFRCHPPAPTGTPSAHTKLEASHNPSASGNHRDQHTDGVPIIGRASTQFRDQQGHNRPQEGTTHHRRDPQIPQHRIHPLQSRPGTSGGNSNGQITPIGTPSTSTKTKSPSTSVISTPQRTRGNISPIRFPTPEPDGLPTSSSLEWESSNVSLNLNAPRRNLTRTNKHKPQDLKGSKLAIGARRLRSPTQKITQS